MIKDGLTHFNLLYGLSSKSRSQGKKLYKCYYLRLRPTAFEFHIGFDLLQFFFFFFLYFSRSSKWKFICANTTNKYSAREGFLT